MQNATGHAAQAISDFAHSHSPLSFAGWTLRRKAAGDLHCWHKRGEILFTDGSSVVLDKDGMPLGW